eukprot:TRINITY_DN10850_c0_g1_i1.p1 TRINITY_DN10850_c0_g1~~TRINITY_DN10850_c0_g1_i1.p1  ORF type:complete len:356 (-),score=22.94 TRINITY_DN10850_c0_g1_i1:169-1137(-)
MAATLSSSAMSTAVVAASLAAKSLASNNGASVSLPALRSSSAVSSHAKAARVCLKARCAASGSSGSQEESSRAAFALKSFREKRAFKAIAGLNNFDRASVAAVVAAAEAGGATLVDIACDAELVRLARSITRMPICVSAVEPEKFVDAVAAGADMVEIGNFDSFYPDGREFTAAEVLALTQRTRQLLPTVALSVTVPHTLPLPEQVALAEALEQCGADVIQTEGGTSSHATAPGVHGLVEKATPTIAATYSIARAVSIPVMCASGLSAVTVPMAMAAGAAGVGVGSAINRLSDPISMVATVREISDAIGAHSSVKAMVDSPK